MNTNQKRLTVGTLLAWALTMVVVPWRLKIVFHNFASVFQMRYGFIWSPPRPHFLPREMMNAMTSTRCDIVIPLVVMEWFILAVFYLVFLKAYKDLEATATGDTSRRVGNGVRAGKGF